MWQRLFTALILLSGLSLAGCGLSPQQLNPNPVFSGGIVAVGQGQPVQVRVFSPSFLNVAFLVMTHLPKVWDSLATTTSPQHDHFCSWVVLVVVHSFLPVWLSESFSPYLPPQPAQVAFSVQVAVPPEQLTVSL